MFLLSLQMRLPPIPTRTEDFRDRDGMWPRDVMDSLTRYAVVATKELRWRWRTAAAKVNPRRCLPSTGTGRRRARNGIEAAGSITATFYTRCSLVTSGTPLRGTAPNILDGHVCCLAVAKQAPSGYRW